jgi:hypothetical protein
MVCGAILKSVVCVAFVWKVANEIEIMIFFQILWSRENEFLVPSNKLTNNFTVLVTSCLQPDVEHRPLSWTMLV